MLSNTDADAYYVRGITLWMNCGSSLAYYKEMCFYRGFKFFLLMIKWIYFARRFWFLGYNTILDLTGRTLLFPFSWMFSMYSLEIIFEWFCVRTEVTRLATMKQARLNFAFLIYLKGENFVGEKWRNLPGREILPCQFQRGRWDIFLQVSKSCPTKFSS